MLLSDRICLMNRARIEQLGAPKTLYDAPRTRFAADFIGDSNILRALTVPGGIDACGAFVAASDVPAPGTAVDAVIRPERVRPADPNASGAFRARIVDIVDLGDVVRLRLALAGGLELKATRLGDGAGPDTGAEAWFRIAPEDVVVLPVEDAR